MSYCLKDYINIVNFTLKKYVQNFFFMYNRECTDFSENDRK